MGMAAGMGRWSPPRLQRQKEGRSREEADAGPVDARRASRRSVRPVGQGGGRVWHLRGSQDRPDPCPLC